MKISKRFFSLLPLCAVPLFNLTSCSVNSKIVFANYESYLSDDVIDKYQNDYSFLYYTTNEDIEVKFKRSYDAAVPSTYEMLRLMKKGLLAQIDWTKFGLTFTNYDNNYPDNTDLISHDKWTIDINDGHDAEKMLTYEAYEADEAVYNNNFLSTYEIIKNTNKYAWENNYFPSQYVEHHNEDNCSILDFCIPYFLQSFIFIYRGSFIQSQANNDEYSINEVLDYTNTKGGPKADKRFVNKNGKPSMCMVDDQRTIYDIARLNEEEINDESTLDVNPPTSNYKTIADFSKTYSTFTDNFNPNETSFVINSDSGNVISNFIDPNNSTMAGGWMYNGDAIGAALGNGEQSSINYWTSKWEDNDKNYDPDKVDEKGYGNVFNAFNNMNTALALDTIVFNKKIEKYSDSKQKELYDFVKDFALDGIAGDRKQGDPTSEQDYLTANADGLYATDEDGNYTHDLVTNLDWNLYVSPWQKVEDYVEGNKNYLPIYEDCTDSPDDDTSYYNFFYDELYSIMGLTEDDIKDGTDVPQSWIDFTRNLYQIKPELSEESNYIELPLTDLQISNMHWAYEENKYKL